ncbi:MAG TPA: DUF1294 domain-containing protein [Sphingobium sp.]|nr:DUF1294 domain-containing protein [Sphingobium sp.]
MSTSLWLTLGLALLAINLAAFTSFGLDKQRARQGGPRVRERTLLLLALVGGSGGAWLGRRHFRHKTRKAGFSTALALITLAQIAILALIVTRP